MSEVGGLPAPEQTRRLLAIMRQAETVDDLFEFAAAAPTQALVAQLAEEEREQLAEEYELLRLRLRGRIKFDALHRQRVLVVMATQPYYSDKQGAEVVDLEGHFQDGRPFRTTSAALNVVRFFRTRWEQVNEGRPLLVRFYRVRHATNPNLWKVREISSPRVDAGERNPFRGG